MKFNFLLFIILAFSLSTTFAQNNSCGLNDTQVSEETQHAMNMAKEWSKARNSRTSQKNEYYICKVAVDIDSYTYNELKQDTTKIIYTVKQQLLEASRIFEKETNTKLILTQINIYKNPETDPYAKTKDIFQQISNLIDNWSNPQYQNINSDVVMLLTTNQLSGAGGVASSIGGRYNISPLYNLRTIVHEIGHNLGSPHTQNCSWPGGMLDYCYQAEGDCYSEALEYSKGTVMSYCSGYKITFHPLCQAIIENNSKKKFESITKVPPSIILPKEIQNYSNYFEVKNETSSEKLIYKISSNENFDTIIYEDSTEIGLLYFQNLKVNTVYYLKVQSQNRFGSSEWSNAMKITNYNLNLDIPKIKTNLNIKFDFNYNIKLEFSEIEGTTEYEIEITNYDNPLFRDNSTKSIPLSSNSINISIKDLNFEIYSPIIWRVRAVNNFQRSEWSKPDFLIPKEVGYNPTFPFNDLSNTPTTFSLIVSQFLLYCNVKVQISENKDFKNPILERVYSYEEYDYRISYLLQNLKNETNYYYKTEILKSDNYIWNQYPNSVILNFEGSFRTNNLIKDSSIDFFHKDNYSQMGFTIDNFIAPFDKALFVSDTKLQTINSDNLEYRVFDRKKTNGEIGLSYSSLIIKGDADNNLVKIVVLGKTDNYLGAFPDKTYALRVYDRRSLKQISSTEFILSDTISYIQDFDPINNLIFDGFKLCRIENKKLIPILSFKNSTKLLNSSQNIVWASNYNSNNNSFDLFKYTIDKKLLEKVNIPGGKYFFNDLKLDIFNNIWINLSDRILGKYDGQNWTFYNFQNSPLKKTIGGFNTDIFGNLYVNSYDKYPNGNILKFSNNEWTILKDNINFTSQLHVDSFGKIWMNSSNAAVIRINPCPEIKLPSIESNKDVVSGKENLTLKASGCTNTIWNWQNKEESVPDKLILGDNQLIISPTTNTTYFARCYVDGCSGTESSKTINVFPQINIKQVLNNKSCENGTAQIDLKIDGKFEDNNKFFGVFKNGNYQQKLELKKIGNYWELLEGTKTPTGKLILKIESTNPKIESKDSLIFEIYSRPKVKIEGPDVYCYVDTKQLIAKVEDGTKPYQYFWIKDKTSINDTKLSTYQLVDGGLYRLYISDSNECYSDLIEFSVNAYKYPTAEITKTQNENIFLNKPDTLKVITQQEFLINWLKDDRIIAGATNSTLVVNEPGNYSVSVDNNGCIFYSKPILLNLILGNIHESISKNIKIYPNPNNGIFTISAQFEKNFTGHIYIYDQTGHLISQEQVSNIYEYKKETNLNNYPSGTYFVVFQGNQNSYISKLIKN